MPCAGIFIIPGGARNLLPLAYERPVPDIRPKRSKTGNFCKKRTFRPKITQLALEFTHGFLSDYALPSPKFPTKITGNYQRITGNFISTILENQFAIYTQSVYKRFIV